MPNVPDFPRRGQPVFNSLILSWLAPFHCLCSALCASSWATPLPSSPSKLWFFVIPYLSPLSFTFIIIRFICQVLYGGLLIPLFSVWFSIQSTTSGIELSVGQVWTHVILTYAALGPLVYVTDEDTSCQGYPMPSEETAFRQGAIVVQFPWTGKRITSPWCVTSNHHSEAVFCTSPHSLHQSELQITLGVRAIWQPGAAHHIPAAQTPPSTLPSPSPHGLPNPLVCHSANSQRAESGEVVGDRIRV